MLQLKRVMQRRRVAAVGAIIGGKFRAIIFKCWVPNPNSHHANTKVPCIKFLTYKDDTTTCISQRSFSVIQ